MEPKVAESILFFEKRIQTSCQLVTSDDVHDQDQDNPKSFQIRVTGIYVVRA